MENTSNKKRNIAGWVVGIAATIALLAMFVGIITLANSRNVGRIAHAEEIRRGTEQTFTYLDNDKLKNGDKITWYVDGERIASYKYAGDAQCVFTPDKVGTTTVTVVAGKYSRTTVIDVKKPLLTLTAQDITVTYGDEIPQTTYECSGLVGEDTLESLNCNVCCHLNENCEGECYGVGVYEITFDEIDCPDYEIAYKTGHLSVKPRKISICNSFEKEYDQTNVLECPNIELSGVIDGDEVGAVAEKLYFANENVGDWNIVTANIELTGKDSANYELSDVLTGRIVPRKITVEGFAVADKYFDGTTRATIEKPGKLHGVLDGDSVAIGNLDVSFDEATIGEHKVRVKVTLVGLDKDNYVIDGVNEVEAHILPIGRNRGNF